MANVDTGDGRRKKCEGVLASDVSFTRLHFAFATGKERARGFAKSLDSFWKLSELVSKSD